MEVIRGALKKIPGLAWLYRSYVNTPGQWIFLSANIAWLQQRDNYQALPGLYKFFSSYCRYAPKPGNHVFGAEWLHRVVSNLTRWFGTRDHSAVHVDDRVVYLLLTDPRSMVVPWEIRNSRDIALLNDYLGAGDVFVDVGANHGSFSLVASSLVGRTGLVVAVEPQPKLAALIGKTLSTNDDSPYEVKNLACSDESGTAEFFIPRSSSGSAGIFKQFSATASCDRLNVILEPFDECVDWRDFTGKVVVKLDVEGSEARFLKGARQAFKALRPVMIMEVNPRSMDASGVAVNELVALLADLGYERWREIKSPTVYPLDTLDSRQRNIVLLPTEPE